MSPDASQSTLLRFATRDLPAHERVPFWREEFARQVVHIDIEPKSDLPFEAQATLLALPDLRVMWSQAATPACWKRTTDLLTDGNDDFAFLMAIEGEVTRSQLGCDLDVGAGEGFCILHAEPAHIRFRELKFTALMVPRSALAPLVADIEGVSRRSVPRGVEALRLLRGYLGTLRRNGGIADLSLRTSVVSHIHDLIALAIGATRDGEAIAMSRGARAARLHAIKCAIVEDPGLTLAELAARQRVTPRYVQMLFGDEGTTFTTYVLEQRLKRAHSLLCDARNAGWTITAIAFQAGFADISHFNRTFRRRYGASPSEIRADALRVR